LEFAVPAPFERAVELAYNLWWAWNPAGHSFWSNLDPVGWERSHNPLEVLSSLDRARWHELEQVEAVQERYRSAVIELDRYMADGDTWYVRFSNPLEGPVAYLCSEFGAHDSIPFYSGGLGILAGDHLKSASDLGVPMIGVGLLYRRGYFRQEIEAEGEQQHFYPTLDLRRLPVLPVASPAGGQLKVEVELPGRLVQVGVWKMQIGKTPLLLLDTDNNDNDPADRPITHTLYVRGREMRLCQELVLGVGAVRALTALGVAPAVWHVNEGHAALSFLERAVRLVEQGALPSIAQGEIRRSSVFTLHTPVPAGNEGFDSELASRYLAPWAERMGLGWEGLSGLATVN
jgi:starch phosphorylase